MWCGGFNRLRARVATAGSRRRPAGNTLHDLPPPPTAPASAAVTHWDAARPERDGRVHDPSGLELSFEQYTRYLDRVSRFMEIHSNVCLAQPFETHYRCTNCPRPGSGPPALHA